LAAEQVLRLARSTTFCANFGKENLV